METLLQDIRYGFRMLLKAPAFVAVAVLTLALGIGANTALFSIISGVLLSPLPFYQPDRLIAVYSSNREFRDASISYPNFLDWVRNNRSFSDLAAFRPDSFELTGMGEPERLKVEMVSANFFPLLGVQPVIGRHFRTDEDQVGAAPVVLISAGLWQRKLGATQDLTGKVLNLNSTAYSVIGVIPASFHYYGGNFYRETDVFVPLGQWNDPTFRDRRTGMGTKAVGRLKPGVTFTQAQSDMDAVAANLASAFPDINHDSGISLIPLRQNVVGEIRPILLVLFASVGFVLLIACANVANLLLARSTGRSREFSIRTALGAGQFRIIRQLLTESVLLSLIGGGLGLLLAGWGTRACLAVLPEALPRSEEIRISAPVLLFTILLSALIGILFGLVPALRTARPDLHEALKEGGRGIKGSHHRTQRVLVIAEMALAIVLLSGGGLMLRSLAALWNVNPGFESQNVLHFELAAPHPLGSTPASSRAAMLRLRETLASSPGVTSASLIFGATPFVTDSELPFWLEGQPKPASQNDMKQSLFYVVQPEYPSIMRIPLRRGRFIQPQDDQRSRPVVVIDERFANLVFGDRDPLGKRVNFEILGITAEVIGIVEHVKQWGLDETSSTTLVQPQCYFSVPQIPDQFLPLISQNLRAVVRTDGPPDSAVASLRKSLQTFDNQMVLFNPQGMTAIISESLASRRFSMILLGGFAALALILSAIGIYGVISYLAAQRTQEIGIRMALGAQRRQVLGMVLGQGLRVAAIGVAIGLAAALALTRFIASLIYGVKPHDPLTFTGVAALLTLVALGASYLPALRATRIDPVMALRYE
jgi:predicted permease